MHTHAFYLSLFLHLSANIFPKTVHQEKKKKNNKLMNVFFPELGEL